jgi:hypothetical protein
VNIGLTALRRPENEAAAGRTVPELPPTGAVCIREYDGRWPGCRAIAVTPVGR